MSSLVFFEMEIRTLVEIRTQLERYFAGFCSISIVGVNHLQR